MNSVLRKDVWLRGFVRKLHVMLGAFHAWERYRVMHSERLDEIFADADEDGLS